MPVQLSSKTCAAAGWILDNVQQFRSKKQQAVDELVQEIVNSKTALILYIQDTDDGMYLSEMMVRCTAQDALLIMDMARDGIQELAIKELRAVLTKETLQ